MTIISKGIDISKHNTIDWSKIKKSEIDFVIIRAGYGFSTTDPQFMNNIENAIKLGLDIGIYYFSYAGSKVDAQKEAMNCLKIISPYRKYINYPVFFDWEDDSWRYVEKQGIKPTKQLISDMAIAFMEVIKASGYKTGNYSNPNYLNNYFDDRVKKYDTWLAHVKNGKGDPLYPSTYKNSEYIMHQYSWVSQVSGIKGNVDMNYCFKDYCGKQQLSQSSTKFYTDPSKNVITKFSLAQHGSIKLSPHFQVKEFKSIGDEIKIHNKLIEILEKLFDKLNCSKIIVNSGYRTPEHDKHVGGDGKGQHTLGRAADIVCYDQKGNIIDARKVCCALEDMGGVYGIGYISPRATHVDTRAQTKKWWGDETKAGAPNISRLGYYSFHKYFNM